MVNQFFIIVDKRDSDKFRKFTIGQFNEDIKEILKNNKSDSVWGFHKGNVNKSVWSIIKKGDIIFLTMPKDNFRVYGSVSRKLIDSDFAKKLWPDDFDTEQINHFIFFDNLKDINLSYNELTSHSSLKPVLPISKIYPIEKQYQKIMKKQIQDKFTNLINQKRPKNLVLRKITNGPPQKNKSEIYRFLRDPTIVKQLKKLYKNKCQICDYTLEYEKNKFYSEVHHYNPLEEGGNDDWDNMIVVCPNHHSEFDYKVIAIDTDGTSIIDKKGNKIAQITFQSIHKLSDTNIKSQLENLEL